KCRKKRCCPQFCQHSMGVDRLFYCILEHCFRDKDQPVKEGETSDGGRTNKKDWEWFDFPPAIAPYHVAIFPLMCKDGLDSKAEEVAALLRGAGLDVAYRDTGSIGRRYARADEIGIPYALTIDYDTLKEGTVTIRYRNDGAQERIKIQDCEILIKVNIRKGRLTL